MVRSGFIQHRPCRRSRGATPTIPFDRKMVQTMVQKRSKIRAWGIGREGMGAVAATRSANRHRSTSPLNRVPGATS